MLDQSGATLGEIPFSLAGPDAATELTRVFGVTPAESESEGGLEVWPAHIYDWSGFELHDELRDGTKPGPYYEYFVWVKTPSVNGIEVRTTGGVHVGDSGASVVYDASSPWPPSSWGNQTCGVEALYSESGDIYDSVGLYVCSAIDTDQVIFFVVPQQLQV